MNSQTGMLGKNSDIFIILNPCFLKLIAEIISLTEDTYDDTPNVCIRLCISVLSFIRQALINCS